MKRKFSFLLCLLLPLLALGNTGDEAFKRTEVKTYNVANGAQFKVSNKYGQIVLHTWNKNEIKATVTITGYGKSDAESQNIVGSVSISGKQSDNTVALSTEYNPGSGGRWFNWGSNKNSKDYVSIDYDIYLPQSLQMAFVENNFGDVVVGDKLTFPTKFTLNYGNYDIRDAADVQLTVNYCSKGRIGKAGVVNLRSNYSDLKAESIRSLSAVSTYSTCSFNSIGEATIKATYDDYKLEDVGSLRLIGTYTDVVAGGLREDLTATLTYGDLKVRKIAGTFKGADLKMTYSDAKLSFARKVPVQLDFRFVYGGIKTGGMELKNVQSDKKSVKWDYSAQANGATEQSPKIKASGTNADISVDVE
ncbi:MAG: hypothetical protein JO154_07700 [Chitinophaga sp.]|uniref:hypothetical protein n=1 Tax=Chitinophaga sp. TaxID=1869181 RepID=UPI0025BBC6DA|nr:hypothetical protein [Chitinophaga sp.]MBV8252476.1 hypothetical protein [Chitinophaga sp.]